MVMHEVAVVVRHANVKLRQGRDSAGQSNEPNCSYGLDETRFRRKESIDFLLDHLVGK